MKKQKKEYQDYKKLFEIIKKRSKKWHFSKLILEYKIMSRQVGKSLKKQKEKKNTNS